MKAVVRNIKGIMVVSGVLTMTVGYAAIAPSAALHSTFGEGVSGPVAELLARNWGVLVALLGALLVHGAFDPATRRVALLAGGISKVWFIALVLSNGTRFLGYGAGTAVAADTVMVSLYALYLLGTLTSGPERWHAASGAGLAPHLDMASPRGAAIGAKGFHTSGR